VAVSTFPNAGLSAAQTGVGKRIDAAVVGGTEHHRILIKTQTFQGGHKWAVE